VGSEQSATRPTEKGQRCGKAKNVHGGASFWSTETFEGWIGVEDDVDCGGGKGSPTGAEIRCCEMRSGTGAEFGWIVRVREWAIEVELDVYSEYQCF
jgi:hypothetical protein